MKVFSVDVFAVDVFDCPQCHSRMQHIAWIMETKTIKAILERVERKEGVVAAARQAPGFLGLLVWRSDLLQGRGHRQRPP